MDANFTDMTDAELAAEREWEQMHSQRNSADGYAVAINALRAKFEAGAPILSEEYAPRAKPVSLGDRAGGSA
jgi:16S rRNA C967 or C1407 C5-methylase (RsmB/RsmF family)